MTVSRHYNPAPICKKSENPTPIHAHSLHHGWSAPHHD